MKHLTLKLIKLHTVEANNEFQRQGATLCVVIDDDPKNVTIEEVFAIAESLNIITDPDEEAGEDLFVVQFGDRPQEALDQDQLQGRLR